MLASRSASLALVVPALLAGLGTTLVTAQVVPSPTDLAAWRVPIHSGTAAHAPDYGIWTSGDSFKASFHDGFSFYPVLGPAAPRNLPLSWRTRSVRRGEDALLVVDAPAVTHSDWRLEYAHPGFREVYEVRPAEGVEQMFVLPVRPQGTGDLVVTGALTTGLRLAEAKTPGGALVFQDDAGRPVLEYGAAWALDQDGRKVEVRAACDGKSLSLVVPGSFLDEARYPVTIDPLVQVTGLYRSTAGQAIGSTDIGAQADSPLYRFFVAYTRVVSASDQDVNGVFASFSFPTGVLVFTDLSVANGDKNVAVAYNAAAQRWLVAFQREFTQNSAQMSGIRVYFHDESVTTLNSGLAIQYLPTSAQPASLRNPDLGGTAYAGNGPTAMVVFTSDFPTSTREDRTDTEVLAYTINCSTRAFGVLQFVGGVPVGTNFDRRGPAINQVASLGEGWTIVWSQYDHRILNDDWDLMGSRTASNGLILDSATLVNGGTRDVQDLAVAGERNTYMVSYGLTADHSSTANTELRVLPFDWPRTGGVPTLGAARTITTAVPPMFGVINGTIALDQDTMSHWAMTYTSRRLLGLNLTTTARVLRLGATGGVTESVALHDASTNGAFPSVCYSTALGSFAQAYGTDEVFSGSDHPLYVSRFVYPADAINVPQGTGCGPATISAGAPYAGNRLFLLSAQNLPAGSVPILLCSLGAASLPLDGLGMTGCVLNVDPAALLLSAVGSTVFLPLPDFPAPPVTGDFHFQFLYSNPGANPASLQATAGLRSQVR